MRAACAFLLFLTSCLGEGVFLHNPRGSNDRLNEANVDRNNGFRLFNSQNGERGGYCYGPPLSYYEGSLLQLEFSPLLGSKNPAQRSNFVLQYMCSNSDADPTLLVRDGTTTDTIPNDANGPVAKDANGGLKYGLHEPRDWYNACETRERNKGLWIADRADPNVGNLNGEKAVNTRQNNHGARYAYECPEERDYYPYWVASPWKDIAVLTDDARFCGFYQRESQNVKKRSRCETAAGVQAPQNQQPQCLSAGNTWVDQPAWNIPAPGCQATTTVKVNSGDLATYLWRLPTAAQEPCIANNNCNCVLRLRYNVSVGDMGTDGYDPANFTDSRLNGDNSPIKNRNRDPAWNPGQDGNLFQLALDTSQTGRIFQDRSFMFHIQSRRGNQTQIHNLNVRGKRGVADQIFPAVEYGFSPEKLTINVGDYVHFQWTGCDTNPVLPFSGEGTAQTDRSNIVQIESLDKDIPALASWINAVPGRAMIPDSATRDLLATLSQTNCLTYEQLRAKNANNQNNVEADVQNCMKLNAAPRYLDGGLVQFNTVGEFYFMSSRNNRPGIQNQKGTIQVQVPTPTSNSNGATATVASAAGTSSSSAATLLCGLVATFVAFLLAL